MTTPHETPKLGRWLRRLACVSAAAGRGALPYKEVAVFSAKLLGMALLLRLVLRVPFATTLTLMAFVCFMRWLLKAWPRNPQTGKRWRRWLLPFACVFSFLLFIGVWSTQPHFGASICPLKGFMWETDFIEEVRPTIRSVVGKRGAQLAGELPAGLTVAEFVAVADQAVDLLKQCIAERSVNYCRYAGPDPNGAMMHGRTVDGPNHIEREDESNYRYIKTGLNYDISMIPQSVSGSTFRLQFWRFGKTWSADGRLCYLGCWCSAEYGR